MFRRGPGRLEMCFYAYKNVLEPMGHHGANLIFSILTLNQVRPAESETLSSLRSRREAQLEHFAASVDRVAGWESIQRSQGIN